MNVNASLNKPYPQIESNQLKVAISLAVGIICFIFLLVFQPFGLRDVSSTTFTFGFGVNAVISLLVTYFLLPSILSSFFKGENWTVGKEAIFYLIVHVIISVLNYGHNARLGIPLGVPHYSLLQFVYMTVAVGVFPTLFMIYINERISFKRQNEAANEINEQDNFLNIAVTNLPNEIHIQSDNLSEEDLKITLNSFVYASSSNNYCDIYYIGDSQEKLEHRLMRISLKHLNQKMEAFEQILRVHKSYLINKAFIAKAEGNARSLYVVLKNIDIKVPVSRSFDRSKLIATK